MKKTILYIIFIVFLFWFLFWENREIKHIWKPTYSTNDKQPYGAYVLDELLESSWEKGYMHTYSNIQDIYDYEIADSANILIVAERFNIAESETEAMFDFVRNGGNILVAAHNFSYLLYDTLNFYVTQDFGKSFSYNLTIEQPKNTIRFCTPGLDKESYPLPISISSYYFQSYNDSVFYKDSVYAVAAMDSDKIVALRYEIGEGNLIFSTNPLAFTNYGVLNDSVNGYVKHLLAYLDDKPLVRTEYYQYGSQGGKSQSPFRYLLSQRPLRWAFYITLLSIFIFMIFTAKRKQRVIPVIKKPANKLLEFVRSIAALYIRRNNNADIIKKKYIYWAEDLKRRYGIDVMNESHDWNFYNRFSLKTGQSVEDVRRLLIFMDTLDENAEVSDEEMMDLITKMNTI